MSSGIKVLRTDEIDDQTWRQICNGYKVCFDIDRTPEDCKKSFSKSITGYSLHALKFNENGDLMGHNYFQPRPYILNGQKVICALSGGTFVMPEYRNDMFIFNELIKALTNTASELGWVAQLGVPNENSFKYAVKINKHKHIGDLSYYLLPVHAGKILRKDSKILDFLSSLYSRVALRFNRVMSLVINNKEADKPFHMDVTDAYMDIRFSNNKYKRLADKDFRGVYRVCEEDGIQTAYIMYFGENYKRTSRSLCRVVKEILRNEKVDAIMYVGTMRLAQCLLTKIPKKYVPQQMPVCVSVFNKNDSELKEVLSSIENINFGLINYDVR